MAGFNRRELYHGLILDEYTGPNSISFDADVAIYVSSWEARAVHFVETEVARARRVVSLSFNDSANAYSVTPEMVGLGEQHFRHMDLGSHYNVHQAIENLIPPLITDPSMRYGKVFVDISSMPKYISQYLIMEILRTKAVSELIVGYVCGDYKYHSTEAGIYDQGIREYLALPHTANKGISVRKGGIAALGADERLIGDYFTNEAVFDEHFLVTADGVSNVAVDRKVQIQASALVRRFNLDDSHLRSVPPSSFLGCLDAYEDFIGLYPDIDSWDIFCCGPKTHAVAACLAAIKHGKIKLIGRVPHRYDTTNVEAGAVVSFLRIIDATSPAIACVRDINSPFFEGSSLAKLV